MKHYVIPEDQLKFLIQAVGEIPIKHLEGFEGSLRYLKALPTVEQHLEAQSVAKLAQEQETKKE